MKKLTLISPLKVDTKVNQVPLVRQSYQVDFFEAPAILRQQDDYFSVDDSVIRSPTYYTKT